MVKIERKKKLILNINMTFSLLYHMCAYTEMQETERVITLRVLT